MALYPIADEMPLPVCESHQVWRYFSMPLHIVLKRAELTRDWYGACFRTCMEPAVPLLNKRTPHDKRPIQNVRITNRAAQPCCSCSDSVFALRALADLPTAATQADGDHSPFRSKSCAITTWRFSQV